ncbi:MAG: uroporphyrinogen-III synthase [Bacteroidia bacterium]|nr:uroporphyrinogen-III synthase [Bacteroidia bacterium]
MASTANANKEQYKRIKTILVSQPKPERSPYYELEKKYDLTIDWRPFIHVEGLTPKEFRGQRVRPENFSAIIFTSKNAIDHFFRICDGLRIRMAGDTKYFCSSEAVANYLQKFIIYRKRKVFAGQRKVSELKNYFNKFKDSDKFLLPCSNLGAKGTVKFLKEIEIDFQEALMYRTVSSDLSDLSDITYDVLVFFSPLGIKSLYDNFPDFKQNETRIAAFGNSTKQAVEERGLILNIQAPAPEVPSMTSALKLYLEKSNK